MAGAGEPRLDGSEYLGEPLGRPALPDPAAEAALCAFLADAAESGLLRSAHDVAAGGAAVALAESAIAGGIGARVELSGGRRGDETLFGEGGGRVLLTCRAEDAAALAELAGAVPLAEIGRVGGDRLTLTVGDADVSLGVSDLATAYERAIPEALA
jgi:phosphoribosylformylglycinamidine synthase subunit PurL